MPYEFRPGRGNEASCCDRCGFKRHRNQLRREWTGLVVCKECWEPRNQQEFVRGVPDRQQVPGGARPEPADVFLTSNLLTQAGDNLLTEAGDNLVFQYFGN